MEEFRSTFLLEEIKTNWQGLSAKKLEQDVQRGARRLNERRRVIKAGLKRMALKRAKKAFDALAAVLREKHADREAKKAQFNRERFHGVESVPRAHYSNRELDSCSSWARVLELRGPPTTLEQLAVERICQEQATQARWARPVGL